MSAGSRNLITYIPSPDEPRDLNDVLHFEPCWTEVSTGLMHILMAYLMSVLGPIFGIAMAAIALIDGRLLTQFERGPAVHKIVLVVGLVIAGISGIIGYFFYYLPGMVRCAIHTAERCGARWLVFASITCMIMGPALEITTSFLGGGAPTVDEKKLQQRLNKQNLSEEDMAQILKEVEINPVALVFQIASAVLGILGSLLFVFYLRAVAKCFEDRLRVFMVDAYVLGSTLFFGGLFFMVIGNPSLLGEMFFWGALVLGIVCAFVWYLVLLVSVRCCINYHMRNIRSPLAEDDI